MAEIKKMYRLLEQMVEGTVQGDKKNVLRLSAELHAIMPDVATTCSTPLFLEYDRCKQSCVMYFEMPDMRDAFLEDAKGRFSKIPKPL